MEILIAFLAKMKTLSLTIPNKINFSMIKMIYLIKIAVSSSNTNILISLEIRKILNKKIMQMAIEIGIALIIKLKIWKIIPFIMDQSHLKAILIHLSIFLIIVLILNKCTMGQLIKIQVYCSTYKIWILILYPKIIMPMVIVLIIRIKLLLSKIFNRQD